MSSRSPVKPVIGYTVQYVWPSDPRRRPRVAVHGVDEQTARESLEALIQMRFAVQVDIALRESQLGKEMVRVITSARWDRLGRVTERYAGRFEECIPAWASGTEAVEVEKRNEPSLSRP